MKIWLIRAISFFTKEIHEIRRQPRLLLSLIGGPFLVLALFGATFQSATPVLRTALVWPEGGIPGVAREEIEEAIDRRFELTAVLESRDEAIDMLRKGRVDVVQVLPANILEQLQEGGRPQLNVYSYAIDPTSEVWIKSLAVSEVHLINRQVLLLQTDEVQKQAITIQVELGDAQGVISRLETNVTVENQRQAESVFRTLREGLQFFLIFLPQPRDGKETLPPTLVEMRNEINSLLRDMDRVEAALKSGEIQNRLEDLRRIARRLNSLQSSIEIFVNLSPDVIVSPLQPTYRNLRGSTYSLVVYYSPGVLALLIQHLAITLGSLALVRERLRGSFEMFRIAPLRTSHLLLGKTMAYSLYVFVTSGALTLLLRLLDVPILGSVPAFLLLVTLLTLASLGIGMMISAVSTSDSQAIQLTMIVLLMSIFFSGFFLPIQGFSILAQQVSKLLPLTHGLSGLQSLMLIGRTPDWSVWLSLIIISLLAYGFVLFWMRRMAKKAVG